jgi:hypothetical protein
MMAWHDDPKLADHVAHDARRPPDDAPYRVFVRKTGRFICFHDFYRAVCRCHPNQGDVLYQHDGKRWRIWTSAGLF